MIDPFAIIPAGVVQETKAVTSTVVSYDDWATLTKQTNYNRISHYRIQSDEKFRYTLDGSDPTESVGFYHMPDWEKDYTLDIFKKMKIIRDGATDVNVTACPVQVNK